jgi:hypothetical protein
VYARAHSTSYPRLLFNKDRIEQVRDRILQDRVFGEEWTKLIKQGEDLLHEAFIPEAYADKIQSQHGNYNVPSGQLSRMGLVLGLIYQITREDKYAERLRDALLYYGRYDKWYGGGLLKREPPWHSELNTARFCFGYGVGYDCIREFLSEDERNVVADSLVRLGILPILKDWVLPSTRIHALDSMGHNWWSVCIAQAGLASLAILGDHAQVEQEQWPEAASHALVEWFFYKGSVLGNKSTNFDSSGAFYESVNYANYGLSEYLLFHLAYTNVYGKACSLHIPILERVGEFFLQMSYPTSSSVLAANFGDGNLYGDWAAAATLLLINGYEDARLRWYLKRIGKEFSSPLGLVYYDSNKTKAPPDDLKTSSIYLDIGWASMRSSWDDDATMLAVKSGFTWNHAHADAGSFMLFHKGKPLVIDSGNCSYGRREYLDYYCQSRAHNVVLFNGQGQESEDLYRGVKESGRLYSLVDQEGLKYVYADATGPMARWFSRNYRHFLWIGNVLLIFDDVRSHQAGKFQWLLHHEGECRIVNNSKVFLSNEDSEALVCSIYPKKLEIYEEEGLKDHDPDTRVPYLCFSTCEDSREVKFITAIILGGDDPQEGQPNISILESQDAIGVKVIQDGRVTDVYLNLRADGRRMHSNSNNIISGWETDAYLMAITRPQAAKEGDPSVVEQYFLSYGSYLRKEDRVIFDSLSKAYVAVSNKGADMLVALNGQDLIEARIYSQLSPDSVLVNDKPVDFEFDSARQLTRFTVGYSGRLCLCDF